MVLHEVVQLKQGGRCKVDMVLRLSQLYICMCDYLTGKSPTRKSDTKTQLHPEPHSGVFSVRIFTIEVSDFQADIR